MNKKIAKHSDTLLIIPIYNGYSSILRTLASLRKQKGFRFDILLIDNGGNDLPKIKKRWPNLNYLSPKHNIGHAGAQYLGAKIALHYKYDYVIFSVQDVVLVNEEALYSMKKALEEDTSLGGVIPVPYSRVKSIDQLPVYIEGAIFCYFFVKVAALRRSGLHNRNLFIYGEDAELSYRLRNHYRLAKIPKAQYFLSSTGPGTLGNSYSFFVLRGLLYVAIVAPEIRLKYRLHVFYYFCLKCLQILMSAIQFNDSSYFDTLVLAIYGAFHLKLDLRSRLRPNRYYLAEIRSKPKTAILLTSHSLLRKVRYYFVRKTRRQKIYYELRQNEKHV